MLKLLASTLGRLFGWRVVYVPPPGDPAHPRAVIVGYPHTSNLDFLAAMLLRYGAGVPLSWIGKHTLFRFPLGSVARALGGVSLDRRQGGGKFTDAVAALIRAAPRMLLAVAAEGTRARAEGWRSGFYYMALDAGVPIGLGFIDWKRREVGVREYLTPTGDLEADFGRMRLAYQGVQGRHPERMTPIRLAPRRALQPTE